MSFTRSTLISIIAQSDNFRDKQHAPIKLENVYKMRKTKKNKDLGK